MKDLPFISIIVPTFNSQQSLPECLESVKKQNYPLKKVELLVVDGSSSDESQMIAKSYNARIIIVPRKKQNAEVNKSIGFTHSKGEYVLILDSDNVLPHKNWLRNMISPFIKHTDVVGSNTLYFTYDVRGSVLDRYLSLFGSLDPVAYYLNKIDKLPYGLKTYTLLGSRESEHHSYFLVRFHPDHLPSIGSNGFLVQKQILKKHAKVDEKHFFHTDIHVDVIRKGFNRYAFVKESITHQTGNRNILRFFMRRYRFLLYNLLHHQQRRHSVYQKQDTLLLLLFTIYSLTFIKPLYDSIKGYRRIPDKAWFAHPFFCFAFLVIYSFAVVEVFLQKNIK